MSFIDYYKSIEKRDDKTMLRNRILIECDIQVPTFYQYMRNGRFPLLVREKISKILGLPVNELFPGEKINKQEFNH